MIKIKRKTKVVENLTKRIKALKNAKVQSGYFEDSGTHEESGMSFAELMQLHEAPPSGYRFPPRPVRLLTSKKAVSIKVWETYIGNYLHGKYEVKNALNHIGVEVTEIAHDIFGDNIMLAPNTKTTKDLKGGKDTPLVDSGSLRDAWTWKVTLTNQ